MATATKLGPIGINQINSVFYVGLNGGFPSIQAAVDYVKKYNGGSGEIIIVHGFPDDEEIAALSNGMPGIYLSDQRDTLIQNYSWNGTQFVAADFLQLANASIGGLVKAFGFFTPDMTASHVSIGTGGESNQIPVLTHINATAPADQRMWITAADANSLYFASEKDDGEDFYWMQAHRTGPSVTKLVIMPDTDVTGVLTSEGSPVRTFANTPSSGPVGPEGPPGPPGEDGSGVMPGTHLALAFYQDPAATNVAPAQIASDSTGVHLTVPGKITGTDYLMNTNTLQGLGDVVQREGTLGISGPGINLGNPDQINGGWTVGKAERTVMYDATRGIHQGKSMEYYKHAVGDAAGYYSYIRSDGGIAAASDEGLTGFTAQVLENFQYFHGTVVSSTGVGDIAPVLAWDPVMVGGHPTSNNWTTDGAFLLNISKGRITGNMTAVSQQLVLNTIDGPQATNLSYLTVTALDASTTPPSVGLPTSTAIGIAAGPLDGSPLIPATGLAADNPVSRTITVKLAHIGTGYPAFVIGPAKVMGSNYPEQTRLTFVSAVNTTDQTQTLTMLLRNPNTSCIVFQGGIANQFISFGANLRFSGMRSSYTACGSIHGDDLIYTLPFGGVTVGGLPMVLNEAARTDNGPNSDYALYPGAEIVKNADLNFACTVEQNSVTWTAPQTMPLTSCANHDPVGAGSPGPPGATTIYTGSGFGAVNSQVGRRAVITGFANVWNPGTFRVLENTATTITVTNQNAQAETTSTGSVTLTDLVENPHFPISGGNALWIQRFQQTVSHPSYGSAVGAFDSSGPGFGGQGVSMLVLRNNNPATNYLASGGPTLAPVCIDITGTPGGGLIGGSFLFLLSSVRAPEGGCIFLDGPADDTNPNAQVNIITIGYGGTGYGNFSYDPTMDGGSFKASGNIYAAGKITAHGGGGAGGIFSDANNNQIGGVQITASNSDNALIFHGSDGSGSGFVWQEERVIAIAGTDVSMNFNTDLTGSFKFHIPNDWHVNGGTQMLVASIDGTGMKIAGGAVQILNSSVDNAILFNGPGGALTKFAVYSSGGVNDTYFQTPHGGYYEWYCKDAGGTDQLIAKMDAAGIHAIGVVEAASFKTAGVTGVPTGTFTTADGKTATVTNGLITTLV